MGRFLSNPKVEQIDDRSSDYRGTWELLEDLIYVSHTLGRDVVVPRGFRTDLASTPRWPFVYWILGGLGQRAAIVHDWLYTTNEVSRKLSDAVFQEALIDCGLPRWKAWLMWAGVRAGGGDSWSAAGQSQPEHVRQKIREAQ